MWNVEWEGEGRSQNPRMGEKGEFLNHGLSGENASPDKRHRDATRMEDGGWRECGDSGEFHRAVRDSVWHPFGMLVLFGLSPVVSSRKRS